jgi:hypothetical protein
VPPPEWTGSRHENRDRYEGEREEGFHLKSASLVGPTYAAWKGNRLGGPSLYGWPRFLVSWNQVAALWVGASTNY